MPIRSDLSENGLVEGYLRGDPVSVNAINGWIDVVLHNGFLPLRDEWDDLRQEIRLRVYANISAGRFRGRSLLRTYVHRIARNTCIDLGRRAHRARERSEEAQTGAGGASLRGLESSLVAGDLLGKLLEGLEEPDRRLLELVFVERLSYSETAAALGVSEGTVKSRVFRCRERLMEKRRKLAADREPAR